MENINQQPFQLSGDFTFPHLKEIILMLNLHTQFQTLGFFFYASLTGIFIFSYLFIFNKWTNCEKGHSWLLYISFSDFPGPRILAMPVRNNKRKDSWV